MKTFPSRPSSSLALRLVMFLTEPSDENRTQMVQELSLQLDIAPSLIRILPPRDYGSVEVWILNDGHAAGTYAGWSVSIRPRGYRPAHCHQPEICETSFILQCSAPSALLSA